MFETVLLPTDFSPDSQKVLGYVSDVPGVKKVILLHIVDATRPSRRGWEHGPHIENAKILLEENRQVLNRNGITADTDIEVLVSTITQGTIPHAILQKADAWNVSLIMMGARGRNTIETILLGSVSANVIRHARIPVLLMRFPPECCVPAKNRLLSRILVPVDFSGPSRDALALLKRIPAAGQVILLHVVDRGESGEEIQDAIQNAREKLAAIERDLALAGITAESRVHAGYPPDEISATAAREEVSLILMSPQGEGWTREIRTLLIGSTTTAVIRRADRPILIAAGQTPE